MFRKPKRNIRQRKVTTDSEDEDENHEYAAKPAPAIQEEKALKKRLSPNGAGGMSYGFAEDEEEAVNLKEIQSNILKFKQSKNTTKEKNKGKVVAASSTRSGGDKTTGNKASTATILSFEQELAEGG